MELVENEKQNIFWSYNMDWFSGDLEKDGQVAQEMDAAVQGEVENAAKLVVHLPGGEGSGASAARLAMKKRKVMNKVLGPGTPEARGEARVKA